MIKFLLGLTAAAMALTACGQPAAPSAPLPTQASPPPAPTSTLPLPTPTSLPATVTPAVVVAPTPEVTATEASLFPPITRADWQIGPANARVTIVEYGDYQ